MTITFISLALVCVLIGALLNIRRQNKAIAQLLQRKSDQLQVSAEELRLLASTFNSHEPILITDRDLKILRVNHAFTEVTGHAREVVIGHSVAKFAASSDASVFEEVERCLRRDGNKRRNRLSVRSLGIRRDHAGGDGREHSGASRLRSADMDVLARRALIATGPNPDPRLDYVVGLEGSIVAAGNIAPIAINLRYIPDKVIVEPSSFSLYLEALASIDWPSLEELAWRARTIPWRSRAQSRKASQFARPQRSRQNPSRRTPIRRAATACPRR